MDETYRPRKSYRNEAIAGLIIFFGMFAANVGISLHDGKISVLIFIGGFWAFLIGLSVWTLLKYYRGSLTIQNGLIRQKGVVQEKTLILDDLKRVIWKCRPHEKIILKGDAKTIKISLDQYLAEQRLEIIQCVRSSAHQDVQQDWDEFNFKIVKHYAHPTEERPIQEGDRVITRNSYNKYFAPAAVLATVLGIGFAWHLGQFRLLLVPIPILFFWGLFWRTWPAQYVISQRDQKREHEAMLELGGCVGLVIAGLTLWYFAKPFLPYPMVWGFGVVFVWTGVLLVRLHRFEQRRLCQDAEEWKQAAREWEKKEAKRASGEV